jgi:hypothetical protein
MIQKLIANLGNIAYQTEERQIDLPRGVNIHKILLRVNATVTIVDPGAGAAGTVLAENAARLLRGITLRHDGVDRAIIDGRWGYRMMRASALDYPINVNLVNGAAQVGTPIEAWLVLPFERPWNAKPVDTIWPAHMPVTQELSLRLQWETGRCNAVANTAQGSTALVQTDSTMSVTFATGPTVDVFVYYSTNRINPAFTPHYTVRNTDPFAAANTVLPFSLMGLPRFDSIFLRDLYGPFNLPQDGVNNITFQVAGGATRYWNLAPFALLQMEERAGFPGVTLTGDTRVGDVLLQPHDKGRLTTTIVPSSMNDPRFLFDVDAPTAPTGRVSMLYCELYKIPGINEGLEG